MSEAFNNNQAQDLIRTSIDHKTKVDLNLDHVTKIEREKALSGVMKDQLKDLYSPEMEENGLNIEQQKNKKAIINAIVDIAKTPQKEEEFDNNRIQLLSNMGNSNETDIENRKDFIITPQEIADEIYGE
jgi:hypothetical protein